MRRGEDEQERLRALVEGREWAPMGTSSADAAQEAIDATEPEQPKAPTDRGFREVELAGLEPATSCMPCKRSPS
jgi:hypothetical protein